MNNETNNARFDRILVVDDTTANLQLLTNLLTEHGYTVYPASDGELALKFVQSTLPDLILLDIRMPGMDGFEVCRRLKADERTRSIPIIFISILEDERDKVKGFREGAVDYITKPLQQEEVLARIQTHLRLRELTERLEQKVAERTGELAIANQLLRQEITEHKVADEALHRLNRELRAISNCNQVLVRVEDEQTLLKEICRIICDEAGYRMAWVGYAENDDARSIRPVAWGGVEEGYLEQANITWADTEQGRGPTGIAIRTGKTDCMRDFTTDPKAAPWREKALQRVYRSSIALPLKDENGETFGALTIYSTEPNAFDETEEMRLLEELAGDMAFGVTALRNRTERKRAEEALRESEEKYRTIFLNSPLGIFRSSFEGRFLDVNPATAKILGYDSPEAVIRGIYNIAEQIYVHTGDRQRIVSEQLGSADITHYINRFRRKDGSEFIANLYLKTIHDAEGRPIYLQGIVEDITERKRAERDIALMNFALNNVHEAAFLIDENAHFNYVNEYVCRALGYSRDELLGLGVPDVDPDFPAELWPSHWDDLKTRGSLTFEGRHRAKDGSIFPVEVNANYFEYEGRGYNLALVRDISERKLAEQERLAHLRFLESLDWINQAIQGTNDLEQMMSDVLDVVLSIFDCDRAFLMYPCDPEAATWRTPMERTRPEYPGVLALGLVMPMAENVTATLRILLDSAGPVQFGPGTEHPLPADVSERFGFKSFMSIALRPKLGKPWQFGIHQCSYPRIWTPDEEKLLQEIGRRLSDGLTSLLAYRDLQENERKLRVALQIGHIGAFAVDIESGRGTFTPELTEFWGMPGDFTGDFLSFCWEHVHPEELPGTKEAFAQMVQSRKEGGMEFRIIRPDGELRWLHWQGQVIQDAAGGPLRAVGVNIDITERKRAEEALKRLNEELEQRVKQRTVELETKNAELARLNKVFVGRELRMVELKEKIRKLEERDRPQGEKAVGPDV